MVITQKPNQIFAPSLKLLYQNAFCSTNDVWHVSDMLVLVTSHLTAVSQGAIDIRDMVQLL